MGWERPPDHFAFPAVRMFAITRQSDEFSAIQFDGAGESDEFSSAIQFDGVREPDGAGRFSGD